MFQEFDDILVRPVEQHGAEEVEVSAVDGLRVVHVVRLERDAGGESFGEEGGAVGGGVGEVLDDEVEGGEGAGDGEGDVAVGAADLGS